MWDCLIHTHSVLVKLEILHLMFDAFGQERDALFGAVSGLRSKLHKLISWVLFRSTRKSKHKSGINQTHACFSENIFLKSELLLVYANRFT